MAHSTCTRQPQHRMPNADTRLYNLVPRAFHIPAYTPLTTVCTLIILAAGPLTRVLSMNFVGNLKISCFRSNQAWWRSCTSLSPWLPLSSSAARPLYTGSLSKPLVDQCSNLLSRKHTVTPNWNVLRLSSVRLHMHNSKFSRSPGPAFIFGTEHFDWRCYLQSMCLMTLANSKHLINH